MEKEDLKLKEESKPIIPLVMVVFLITSIVLAAFLFVFAYNQIKHQSHIDKYVELESLKGLILQYDEVLTMSARMAATTGDARWERRYLQYEPELDRAIKEARSIAPDVFLSEAAKATDLANIALVHMEKEAFEEVKKGNLKKAQKILFSKTYELEKKNYSRGMQDLKLSVGEHIKLTNAQIQADHIKLLLILTAVLIATLTLWIFMILSVRKWRDLIHSLNEKLRVKMLEQSRLSVLGKMAAGVAHEVNNPLTIVVMNLNSLKERAERGNINQKTFSADLEKAEDTCIRISKIIKGLQSTTREGGGDPLISEKLNTILEDVIALSMQRFKAHNVDFLIPKVSDAIRLQCRPTEIAQVLFNLLSNAFDAVENEESKVIKLDARETDDHIEVSVSDSGKGIPRDIEPEIFEPFYTTKDYGRGTGIGLSISRGIVESYGGTLTLDRSSPETRFVVHLPKQGSR